MRCTVRRSVVDFLELITCVTEQRKGERRGAWWDHQPEPECLWRGQALKFLDSDESMLSHWLSHIRILPSKLRRRLFDTSELTASCASRRRDRLPKPWLIFSLHIRTEVGTTQFRDAPDGYVVTQAVRCPDTAQV